MSDRWSFRIYFTKDIWVIGILCSIFTAAMLCLGGSDIYSGLVNLFHLSHWSGKLVVSVTTFSILFSITTLAFTKVMVIIWLLLKGIFSIPRRILNRNLPWR